MAIVVKRSVTSSDEQVEKMLNLFYPVGSYYETSDTTFNPNTAWGGTWVEDTAGRMLVAMDTSTFTTVGDTGGTESHQHNYGMQFAGYYGEFGTENNNNGLLTYNSTGISGVGTKSIVSTGARDFNSSTGDTFVSKNSGDFRWMGNTEYTSNLPPYTVIKRWHRTA